MIPSVKITAPHCRKDDRGVVVWPVPELLLRSGDVSNLHVPSIKPGAVRGNHYHAQGTEYLIVLCGPCKASFFDRQTGESWEAVLTDNLPLLIEIPPNIVHAFKNTGTQDIMILCYESPAGTPDAQDTHRHVILS